MDLSTPCAEKKERGWHFLFLCGRSQSHKAETKAARTRSAVPRAEKTTAATTAAAEMSEQEQGSSGALPQRAVTEAHAPGGSEAKRSVGGARAQRAPPTKSGAFARRPDPRLAEGKTHAHANGANLSRERRTTKASEDYQQQRAKLKREGAAAPTEATRTAQNSSFCAAIGAQNVYFAAECRSIQLQFAVRFTMAAAT